MRILWSAATAVPALLLAGCTDLLSVHPLATAETSVSDPGLVGQWTSADKDSKGTALIRTGSDQEKEYDIIWIPGEADDEPLRLKGRLVKVGTRIVFDLVTPKKPDMAVPGHFFMLVEKTPETLQLHWLDSEWLREQVRSQQALAYTLVEGKPVITSGSAEINAFLAKYGLDKRAVSDTLVFTRVKAQ
jgi:hypothetical protein